MLLRIPAIGIDDPLTLAHASGGVLYAPPDPSQVGWWPGSTIPGSSRGHTIVVAHTVHTGGGAFDRLPQLRAGAPITVGSAMRSTRYVVRSVDDLTLSQFAASAGRIFTKTGPPRLVLVTCTGWDGHSYRGNEVVTAVPTASGGQVGR